MNGMWEVTIYKDYGYDIVSYSKLFNNEWNAYDFFEEEIKDEFRSEIREGLVSDQEIQNIINNDYYRFESDNKEILISIKEIDDKEDII